MYNIGDLIIYGNHGVCKVEAVSTPEICGIDKNSLYYTLCSLYHKERIFTPVDTNVFMRPVITYEEAQQLISLIPSIVESVYNNRRMKLMEEHYQEFMQTHECSDLIRLLKSIYAKKIIVLGQGKRLGQIEERFMRRAEDLLFGEFSAALDIPKESVKSYIDEKVKECDIAYAIN